VETVSNPRVQVPESFDLWNTSSPKFLWC